MRLFHKMRAFVADMKTNAEKISRPKLFVYIDMLFSAVVYGASPANYVNFDFINANFQERETFLTHRFNEKLFKKCNDPSECYRLEDKLVFADTFSEFYGRKYAESTTLSRGQFNILSAGGKVVDKPRYGGQGRDIVVHTVTDENRNQIFERLKECPNRMIEEWILQHKEFNRLYPGAVNPIRIQTLLDKKYAGGGYGILEQP